MHNSCFYAFILDFILINVDAKPVILNNKCWWLVHTFGLHRHHSSWKSSDYPTAAAVNLWLSIFAMKLSKFMILIINNHKIQYLTTISCSGMNKMWNKIYYVKSKLPIHNDIVNRWWNECTSLYLKISLVEYREIHHSKTFDLIDIDFLYYTTTDTLTI